MGKVKEKKEALVKKTCMFCGIDTSDYLVYKNGAVCKKCQAGDKFKQMKAEENG